MVGMPTQKESAYRVFPIDMRLASRASFTDMEASTHTLFTHALMCLGNRAILFKERLPVQPEGAGRLSRQNA